MQAAGKEVKLLSQRVARFPATRVLPLRYSSVQRGGCTHIPVPLRLGSLVVELVTGFPPTPAQQSDLKSKTGW